MDRRRHGRDATGLHPLDELTSARVVNVDDAEPGQVRGEQTSLGLEVIIEGLVEVKMIATEVGEGSDIETGAVDPLQGEGVGGDLHDDVGRSPLSHGAEETLEIRSFRGRHCGTSARQLDTVELEPNRPDRPDVASSSSQTCLHQEGRRRLAIGTSDTEHRHGISRMAEDLGSRDRHRSPGIRDDDDRHTGIRSEGRTLVVSEDCHRTGLCCRASESSPMGVETVQTDVQVAVTYLTGVQGDPADRRTVLIGPTPVELGHQITPRNGIHLRRPQGGVCR